MLNIGYLTIISITIDNKLLKITLLMQVLSFGRWEAENYLQYSTTTSLLPRRNGDIPVPMKRALPSVTNLMLSTINLRKSWRLLPSARSPWVCQRSYVIVSDAISVRLLLFVHLQYLHAAVNAFLGAWNAQINGTRGRKE